MSDAFISYARKDEDIVDRLVGALIDAGIDYWIDKNNIAAGRTDFLEIPKELEAATCVRGITIIFITSFRDPLFSLLADITGSELADLTANVFTWGLGTLAIIYILKLVGINLTHIIIRRRRGRKALAADRAILEDFKNADNSTRALIAEHFLAFQTVEVREKFVRWLGVQRLGPEGGGPAGDWPEGIPPNIGDTASSLLARLEHRWRKLDR